MVRLHRHPHYPIVDYFLVFWYISHMNRYESGNEENTELPQEVVKSKIEGYLNELMEKFFTYPKVPLLFRIGESEGSNDRTHDFDTHDWSYFAERHERTGFIDFSMSRFRK